MAHVYGLHHTLAHQSSERPVAETGSGFGNCIMVRLGAREIVKLNNKAQKKQPAASRDDGFIMSTLTGQEMVGRSELESVKNGGSRI